jgi:hypothetical protein
MNHPATGHEPTETTEACHMTGTYHYVDGCRQTACQGSLTNLRSSLYSGSSWEIQSKHIAQYTYDVQHLPSQGKPKENC